MHALWCIWRWIVREGMVVSLHSFAPCRIVLVLANSRSLWPSCLLLMLLCFLKKQEEKKKSLWFFLFIFVWFLFVWFCFLPGPYCVSHRNPFIILNLAWVRDISPLGWPPTANKYPDWIQPSHGFGLKRIQCNWFNKVVYQSHGQKISNYKCSHV